MVPDEWSQLVIWQVTFGPIFDDGKNHYEYVLLGVTAPADQMTNPIAQLRNDENQFVSYTVQH